MLTDWLHHLLEVQRPGVWDHARPQQRISRPDLTLEDYQEGDWETIAQKIYCDQQFKTDPKLKQVSLHEDVVRQCMERDQFSCVVTRTKSDKLFPFIPLAWTDTVSNN